LPLPRPPWRLRLPVGRGGNLMDENSLTDFLKKNPMLADMIKGHPLDDLIHDYPHGEVQQAQLMMASSAVHFLDGELEAMRVVIRLTVEFRDFIRRAGNCVADAGTLQYVGESVFSGLDSFLLLSGASRTTEGAEASKLRRDIATVAAVKEEFVSMYAAFLDETGFGARLGLLLDLFKLQIVFAGLTYG
jgi:hypothetical protein